MTQENTPRGRRLPFTLFGAVVLAFGLLLWARLLLVTGHPKTAVAEPPRAEGQRQTQPTPHAMAE